MHVFHVFQLSCVCVCIDADWPYCDVLAWLLTSVETVSVSHILFQDPMRVLTTLYHQYVPAPALSFMFSSWPDTYRALLKAFEGCQHTRVMC